MVRVLVDQISNLAHEFTIHKYSSDKYDLDIDVIRDEYHWQKRDAKRIRHIYDWSTCICSWPPGIKDSAVDFQVEVLRAVHTMKHDGYYLGVCRTMQV